MTFIQRDGRSFVEVHNVVGDNLISAIHSLQHRMPIPIMILLQPFRCISNRPFPVNWKSENGHRMMES